jgi:sodium-dependent dicarboxylate transporter 2/3/5
MRTDKDICVINRSCDERSWLSRHFKTLVLILTPLLLSPLLLVNKEAGDELPYKCAFVVLLMAIYWSTEPLPVPITSLFPVFMLPLLGLVSTEDACKPYLQEPNMVFVGSLIFAIAVEKTGLHKRVALIILQIVGMSFDRIILGFMLTTMLVAMWIINTAAAAMMLPIADALLEEVFPQDNQKNGEDRPVNNYDHTEANNNSHCRIKNGNRRKDSGPMKEVELEMCVRLNHSMDPEPKIENLVISNNNPLDILTLKKMFYLSIAYSANIGGTSTLTSNGPNLILRFVLDNKYSGLAPLDYTNWLMFNAPAVILTVVCMWLTFRQLFFRKVSLPEGSGKGRDVLRKKYHSLGHTSFSEYTVLFLFVCLVLLWMMRDPTFMTGWATRFPIKPKDATVVIFIITLLFVLPMDPFTDKNGSASSKSILDWPTVQSKLAWGVILLRGGGYSLANAVNVSGLSLLVADQFSKLDFLSIFGMIVVFSVITALMTEFASNSAVASVLLPIATDLAVRLHVNPLLLMIPMTLSCSYAFILPVGTPANALVFEHAKLSTTDMILPGFVAQTICLIIMILNLYTLGFWIFDLGTFPEWINVANATTTI